MPAPYGDGQFAIEPPSGGGLNITDTFRLVLPDPGDPGTDSKIDSVYPNVAIITQDFWSNRFGAMWAKKQLDLDLPFSTEMYIHLGHKYGSSGTVADGMTFTMHNDPAGDSAIGGAGEGLAVYRGRKSDGSSHRSYLRNSLAIEFDTYKNTLAAGDFVYDPGEAGVGHCSLIIPDAEIITEDDHLNTHYFPISQDWILFEASWTPDGLGGGALDYSFNGVDRSYTIASIADVFSSNLVYWGFTGSTGEYTSVQAAAITKLPEQGAYATKAVTNTSGESIDQGVAFEGDIVTYTIRVTSQSDTAAVEDVVIIDELSQYLDLASTAVRITTGSGGPTIVTGSLSGSTLTIDTGTTLTLAGDWLEASFDVTVRSGIGRQLVPNRATVEAAGITDLVQTNITEFTVLAAGDPEKRVSGSSESGQDSAPVAPGDLITYEIMFTNPGTASADVVITDTLPSGVDFVALAGSIPPAVGSYDPLGHTVTWTVPALPSGATGTVAFTVRVNATAVVKIENSAEVSVGGSGDRTTNITQNPVTPEPPVKSVSDSSAAGQNGAPVETGDLITYEISYLNSGESVSDIVITDTLAPGLDYVSSTAGGLYSTDSHSVVWTLSAVPSGVSGTVSVTVRVNDTAVIMLENSATVQLGGNSPESTNIVQNPVVGQDPVKRVAGTSPSGQNGSAVRLGDVVTYEISYFNDSQAPATFTITDEIIDALGFVSITGGGQFDETSRTASWVIPDVPSGTGGVVTISVMVNSLAADVITNQALVTSSEGSSVSTNVVENPVIGYAPEKSVDPSSASGQNGAEVQRGDLITFRIAYDNYETSDETVVITDPLSIGVDFVSATGGGVYDSATRMVSWTIPDVPAGTGGFVTVTVAVNEKAASQIANYATVQIAGGIADTNPVLLPLRNSRCANRRSTGCRLTLRGEKLWVDGDNSGNTRPPAVDIVLLRDGEVYKSLSLSAAGDGSFAFGCLPVWRTTTQKYSYTLTESGVPASYTSTVNGYTITNTLTQA